MIPPLFRLAPEEWTRGNKHITQVHMAGMMSKDVLLTGKDRQEMQEILVQRWLERREKSGDPVEAANRRHADRIRRRA